MASTLDPVVLTAATPVPALPVAPVVAAVRGLSDGSFAAPVIRPRTSMPM